MITVHVASEVRSHPVTFSAADIYLVSDRGGLTVLSGRDVLAEFQPSVWTYVENNGGQDEVKS